MKTGAVCRERFTLNMGLSHAEFFRTLPAALGERAYRIDGRRVLLDGPAAGQRLTIELGPEQRRRIALLSITHTDVDFRFEGYRQADIDDFMAYFMARYQRGGG